jgi:hypothetical protein
VRQGGTIGQGVKIAQKRRGRPKKASPLPVFPRGMGNTIRTVTEEEVRGKPGQKPPTLEDFGIKPPPPSEANPVFSMLKSKLPAAAPHDPATAQFKTAKAKK